VQATGLVGRHLVVATLPVGEQGQPLPQGPVVEAATEGLDSGRSKDADVVQHGQEDHQSEEREHGLQKHDYQRYFLNCLNIKKPKDLLNFT
jgi:hypothetical protein